MRKYILILFSTMLFSNITNATSSEISNLINSAKQSYKSKDYNAAVSAYEQAIKLGSPKAMISLSFMYKTGKGVEKNKSIQKKHIDNAITIYTSRANNSDADAQYQLGRIFKYHVKPARKSESYKWFLKSANNNHMKAQYVVATIFQKGSSDPKVKRNSKEATKWFEKSAKQGDSGAAFKLAYNNRGDFDYVLKWCMPVAKQQDDRWSLKCLEAINVIVGRKIYSKKYKQKAISAIKELANSDIVMSQAAVAKMYEEGKLIPKDENKAEEWSSKAFNTASSKAENGNKRSQYELALLYKRGIGTDVDIDKAREWLEKSSKQRYRPAKKALARLRN